MTPAQLAARIRFVNLELLREATHCRNPLTDQRLRRQARRLLYRQGAAWSPDPTVRAEVEQLVDEAIDTLVDVITNSEPGLAEGAPR